MSGDEAFEQALNALLTGDPVGAAGDDQAPAGSPLDALRVLSAIDHTSRAALFGTEVTPRATLTWGHIEIREEIGRGSSGTVYRGWDTQLRREVALKLIDPDSASADAALAEGRLLARLRHPNIVTVYGVDTCNGVAGLWMELVQGDTLDEVMQRDGVFSIEDALFAGIDLAGALASVHAAGMLHRDVKARNVVRQRGGRLVLMDFGAGHGSDLVTSATDAAGTPLYMAPEVLAGAPASVQSDVYGLGVLLYHLVTRTYPVTASDLVALEAAHRATPRRDLTADRADVPLSARQVIERACAADPAERFASAHDLEAALTRALADVLASRAHVVPTAVRRWRRWRSTALSTAAMALALILGTVVAWNTTPGRAARRAAGLAVPPRSPLYFTFGGGIGRLDGTAVRIFSGGNQGAHALAVSAQHGIRAMASAPPWLGDAWFRLDGTPVRPVAGEVGLCCYFDGTTDGHFNYALREDSSLLLEPTGSRFLEPPAIYRFDLQWRNGARLFALSESAPSVSLQTYFGIAFAAASDTFWVTRRNPDGAVHGEQWSRAGRRLSTIPLRPGATSLAIDPLDGTLWVLRDEASDSLMHFDNLDVSGKPLGSIGVVRPFTAARSRYEPFSSGGMEFAWPAAH